MESQVPCHDSSAFVMVRFRAYRLERRATSRMKYTVPWVKINDEFHTRDDCITGSKID